MAIEEESPLERNDRDSGAGSARLRRCLVVFMVDSGGLSTVPPTLFESPLIGRIERARRQNCGDGRIVAGVIT